MPRQKPKKRVRKLTRTEPPTKVVFQPAKLHPKTPNQEKLIAAIRHSDVVIAHGPAGCGKTVVSIGVAVELLRNNKVERIIISRPLVGAGEDSGALPGSANEKIRPYLQPLFDELKQFTSFSEMAEWQTDKRLEIVPIQFMRGRTFKNAFIIIDEAQNATLDQLKMVLSRLGEGSKLVVEGDPQQTDLPKGKKGGFDVCIAKLQGMDDDGLVVVELTKDDIVRHPLVAKIIERLM